MDGCLSDGWQASVSAVTRDIRRTNVLFIMKIKTKHKLPSVCNQKCPSIQKGTYSSGESEQTTKNFANRMIFAANQHYPT